MERYFRDDDGNLKRWLSPQVLGVAKRWLAEGVTLKDNTFPQLLLLIEFAHGASDRIYKAIVASSEGEKALKPILRPYDEAKISTARTLWVPAVNNHGGFGRWAFLEISDPWDAKNAIHATLEALEIII